MYGHLVRPRPVRRGVQQLREEGVCPVAEGVTSLPGSQRRHADLGLRHGHRQGAVQVRVGPTYDYTAVLQKVPSEGS